jgi:hypothetical protein
MTNPPSPLARRIELGALLRNYRSRAGLDAAEIAKALGWSYVQKVGLVEGGKRTLAPTEVSALADLFELNTTERAHVSELAAEARKRDQGPAFVADWAQTYIALEGAASHLKLFTEELVPGLLQTEEYARTVLTEGLTLTPDEIELAVERRSERQIQLTAPGAPRLTAVISESSLCRLVGSPTIMMHQLEHIAKVASLPNVALHVLPFKAGAHLALGTSFTLLHLGDPAVTFVYVEELTDSDFYDRPPHTEVYTLAFDRAHRSALSQTDTSDLLNVFIQELKQME